ncbi:hypothetical protein NL676_033003 [Syzygium grande]|nr:hypothetical protein NL676_033003 [Syzygium grande]
MKAPEAKAAGLSSILWTLWFGKESDLRSELEFMFLLGQLLESIPDRALTFSPLIAGIAATLSAFYYAELASRCPSVGSAYHYSYICVGEGVAWLIGWALILNTQLGTVFLRFLARQYIPGLDIVVDPCVAVLVIVVTGLLCVGIKELAVIWVSRLDGLVLPFGVDGMLVGSATVFFAYIGFDSVASTAEKVKNPQRDLPLVIAAALSICCALYMMVSIVIVGLVPYFAMDPDISISSAFASHGMH